MSPSVHVACPEMGRCADVAWRGEVWGDVRCAGGRWGEGRSGGSEIRYVSVSFASSIEYRVSIFYVFYSISDPRVRYVRYVASRHVKLSSFHFKLHEPSGNRASSGLVALRWQNEWMRKEDFSLLDLRVRAAGISGSSRIHGGLLSTVDRRPPGRR